MFASDQNKNVEHVTNIGVKVTYTVKHTSSYFQLRERKPCSIGE